MSAPQSSSAGAGAGAGDVAGGVAWDVAWAAADWGTSHLRLWLMDGDGQPLHRIDDPRGMGQLRPDQYEPVLLDHLTPYLPADGALTVLCCGMAGSRQGWAEAPYVATPCSPLAPAAARAVPTQSTALRVHVLAGIKQASPADVMRGEETQIAGLLHQHPGFDGWVCLPGTHTKWARVSGGQVLHFQTFLTGELFALLSQSSVLRHSIAPEGWEAAAFAAGLADAAGALTARLFGLRAEALLNGLEPAASRARLSGLLIGAELAAVDPQPSDTVALIGEASLSQRYQQALAWRGVQAEAISAEAAVLSGLRAAHAVLG